MGENGGRAAALAAQERLIVALDVDGAVAAEALLHKLGDEVRWVKIGLELFCAEGPSWVASVVARGYRVMLDLKLHDIPETVRRAVLRCRGLGAEILTVHASGGEAMLRAAAEAAGDGMQIAAVTVLTSLQQQDVLADRCAVSVAELVAARAELAAHSNVRAVVCSPLEAAVLRPLLPQLALITPGIRGVGDAVGDQARVASVSQAMAAGAHRVVVGRPIRDADDPRAAARAILAEIEQAGVS